MAYTQGKVISTVDASIVTMIGGGTAQEYAGFNTRPDFVTWAVTKGPVYGTIISAAGLSYRYIGTGTLISDLPGWVPFGKVFPDHWAENTTPGTTDMGPAIASALSYTGTVYLQGVTYATRQGLAWNSTDIVGEQQQGAGKSMILGLSAYIAVGTAIIAPGRSARVQHVRIAYNTLTGAETQDQRVGLDTRGLSQTLQRGSFIDEVLFDNVGTAISDYGEGEFSVTYGTLEISKHSYRAVDIRGVTRTGSVWLNLYINGGDNYTPEGGFCITGQCSGGFIGQLNVEHQTYTGYPVRFEGLQGLVAATIHIEGADCSTAARGYLGLDSTSITIQSLNVINTRMTTDNTAVVRLSRAGYQSTAVSPLIDDASPTSNLKIGKLHIKGLASPNNAAYPSYPVGRTGVRNCPGFNVLKRLTSYVDDNWLVEVDDFLWSVYPAQVLDRPYVEFPDVDFTGQIQIRRMGERGHYVRPYENYVQNGAFDKWLATTGVATTSTPVEVANRWALRVNSGSLTLDQVNGGYGQVSQFDAKVTVVTGTYQTLDQDVEFPVEWLDQKLRLQFDMKALAAGRVFHQIMGTLQNPAGSPTTVFKQIASGASTAFDATTSFKTYWTDFTAVLSSAVTTLDPLAKMRISFQFNEASAVRAPTVTFRNVSLHRLLAPRFMRHTYDRLALRALDISDAADLSTAQTITGAKTFTGNRLSKVTAPAVITGAATLTNANLQTTLISYTGAAAAVTFPLGTTLDGMFAVVDTGFEFSVVNTGSGTATMTANTGVTILGAATVAAATSARWVIRRTAASTYVAYRTA